MIKLKRAYEKPAEADGERYLVDRLWPRGIKKEEARLTDWLKGLAPSNELRQWFDHNLERWDEFQERYAAELEATGNMILIEGLADRAQDDVTVTLVYAARDQEYNNAVVLKRLIQERHKQG
jgi:uncharacterized protein YeaO (DUF488 family)